ncbi:MAG: hypothetical protein ABIQ95_02135, partial [Bdellovibrionia bacterium]
VIEFIRFKSLIFKVLSVEVKKLGLYFKRLFLSETGQATTEYILLLAVVVSMFLLFKKILGPFLYRISNAASASIENKLGGNLHYFRIGH